MTNYDEFKAIADDIAEMYANGYYDYAKYYSDTFADYGVVSAITRLSDRVFSLRDFLNTGKPEYDAKAFSDGLKGIAIDAILAIGEVNGVQSSCTITTDARECASRYYCCKDFFVCGETLFEKGSVYESSGSFTVRDETGALQYFTEDSFNEHFQKFYEKK